ncbi:MAG TPA: NAD(P)H-binding protein [Segetibacter sp.]
MTVTIFGSTGMVGKYLVKQALALDCKVIAFGRNIEKLIDADLDDENLVALRGYVFDEENVFNALKGSDAVLSALGGAFDGTDKTRTLGIKNIISQMKRTSIRRIIGIGGMGVLNANEHSLVMDSAEYPQQYLAVGNEHLQAYKYLEASNLDWTFVCPPTIIDKDGNEAYATSEDYKPSTGRNEVAAGNIADFMLKELKENKYIHKRVGIADIG